MLDKSRNSYILPWACLLAGISVMLGAFGSHGLKSVLSEQKLEVFNKAGFYLLTHSISVILLLVLKNTSNFRISNLGINTLFYGTIIFSCSVYLVSFSELENFSLLKYAGATAPIGGLLMISGWFFTAFTIFKNKNK